MEIVVVGQRNGGSGDLNLKMGRIGTDFDYFWRGSVGVAGGVTELFD